MKKLFSLFALTLTVALSLQAKSKEPVLGIAYSGGKPSSSMIKAVEDAGFTYVLLDKVTADYIIYDEKGNVDKSQLGPSKELLEGPASAIKKNRWRHSNVKQVMKGIDAVLFTGGADVSPNLFCVPDSVKNNGEKITPTRDVSDYLLMSWCIDHNVPTLGICRGMQMMGIVSGGTMIQDIPNACGEDREKFQYMHRRKPGAPSSARHDIDLVPGNSVLRQIIGQDVWYGCFSGHHQTLVERDGCKFIVTGVTYTGPVTVIEAIEIPGKKFFLGIQSHPELAYSAGTDSERDFARQVFGRLKEAASR